MRIFWANLRLAFMVRGYLLILTILLLTIVAGISDSSFVWFCLLLALGMFTSGSHGEIAATSLSFCLPGYRDSLRYLILLDVLLGALMIAVCFGSLGSGQVGLLRGLYVVSGFVIGLAVLLLFGTVGIFRHILLTSKVRELLSSRYRIAGLIVLGVLIVSFCFLPRWIMLSIATLIGLVTSAFTWIRLGHVEDMRNAHRLKINGPIRKMSRVGAVSVSLSPLDKLLFGMFQSSRSLDLGRCVWGNLFVRFSPFRWKPLVIFLIIMTLVLGFLGTMAIQFGLLAMSSLSLVIALPINSDMLLPEGRKEKFYSAVVMAITITLLILGTTLVLTGLSWLFERGISFLPLPYRYVAINPGDIWLVLMLVPWFFDLDLLRHRRPVLSCSIMVVGVVLSFLAIFMQHYTVCADAPHLARIILIVTLLGGWGVFLLVLKFVCTRGSFLPASIRRLKEGA